jgi:hypothetical protein
MIEGSHLDQMAAFSIPHNPGAVKNKNIAIPG